MSRPPPNPLPAMPGNFDYPPASSSVPGSNASAEPADITNASARLRLLSAALRQERERDRSRRDTAATERQHHGLPGRSPLRPRILTRGSRVRRAASNDATPSRRQPMLPSPSPPPHYSSPPRPRATPGERFQSLRRQRQQREQGRTTLDGLEEASERLAQASSALASLLSPTNFYLRDVPSPLAPAEPEPEPSARQRRKRRKLDHDSDAPFFRGFRYGHFGQVVPGKLKMELVSCDGGDFEEDNLALYTAENILKNDKSVYCTKSNRCNILLRHQGDTTFCLEKLVIKAPERGFTAPVQEGMVFVSMAKEGLISGTSRYQIHYSNSSPATHMPQPSNARDRERLTFLESLHDPEVIAAAQAQAQEDYLRFGAEEFRFPNAEELHETEDQHTARANRTRRRFAQRYLNRDDNSSSSQLNDSTDGNNENCDWPLVEHETTARDVRAPTPPPITVTTETDNDSSEEEEMPSAAIMADRARRDSRWRVESDSEEEFHFPPTIDVLSRSETRRYGSIGFIRAVQRTTESRIEPKESAPEDPEPVLPPHAKFFIKKDRSKVTIKFDPPISGKYMLLKLWSPGPDTNIDIQSVMTYGFAGPRFFPSCDVR